MKKLWGYIVAAFSVIIGLFFLERSRRKNAEAKISNAEYKKEDAILQEKQKQTEASIVEQQKKIQEIKDQHAQSTQENSQNLTPEQVEEYWKSRRDS